MQAETSFQVKQASFEGPIEVLLDLIEKRKLFVNDISLTTVTDDFLRFMSESGMQPDIAASFLSVAATLILIKARSLLPNLELSEDEKESIEELERRVAIYSLIVEVSGMVVRDYGKQISFEGTGQNTGPIFAPDEKLTLESVLQFVLNAITRVPPPEVQKKPEAKVYRTISIREVLSTLEDRIVRAMNKLTFKDISVVSPDVDEKSQKVYTIVSFLGMLELVRRGFIEAEQTESFETISIERQKGISIPVVSEDSYE